MLLIFHTKVSVTILARSRFYPQGLEESVFTKQENFDKHAILTRSTNILALQNKKAIFIVFHQSSRTFQLRMSEILLGVRSTREWISPFFQRMVLRFLGVPLTKLSLRVFLLPDKLRKLPLNRDLSSDLIQNPSHFSPDRVDFRIKLRSSIPCIKSLKNSHHRWQLNMLWTTWIWTNRFLSNATLLKYLASNYTTPPSVIKHRFKI